MAVISVRDGLGKEGDGAVGAVIVFESKPEWEFVEVGDRLLETGTGFAPVMATRPSLLSLSSVRWLYVRSLEIKIWAYNWLLLSLDALSNSCFLKSASSMSALTILGFNDLMLVSLIFLLIILLGRHEVKRSGRSIAVTISFSVLCSLF